jgi:short-subunit dehydrogenase
LGEAFAWRFAQRGADVVLVARRKDRLDALASHIEAAHGVKATAIPLDLGTPDAAKLLDAELAERGLAPDALINSAGIGTAGPVSGEDPARVRAELELNVVALTAITVTLLPRLISSGNGLLVNVASNAGYQPLPGLAVYAASKAYVKSFTEAIWKEAQGTGMRVLSLAPGPTETEFFEAAGSDTFKVGSVDTAERVMEVAFRAIDRRRGGPTTIVGLHRAIQAHANRLVPTRLSLAVTARLTGAR